MKVAVTLVVSMLLCSLFSIPAFAATVGGEGEIAVLIVRRADLSEAEANDIGRHMVAAVNAASILVTSGPESGAKKLKDVMGIEFVETAGCVSKPKCLARMGVALGVTTIVTLEVGGVRKSVAAVIEAISTSDGKHLLQGTFTVPRGSLKSGSIAEFDDFAKKLKDLLIPSAKVEKKPEMATPPPTPLILPATQAKEDGKKVEVKAPEAKTEPVPPATPAKPTDVPKAPEVKPEPAKPQEVQAKKEEAQPTYIDGKVWNEPPKKKTPKKKIAVLDVRAVGTFDPKSVQGLTEIIAAEATSRYDVTVITSQDISATLGFEREKALLGCTDSTCLSDIGGALGVEYLLVSEVSEVGGVWSVTCKLLDAKTTKVVNRVIKQMEVMKELNPRAQSATTELLAVFPPKSTETINIASTSEPPRILRGVGIAALIAGALTAGTGAVFGVMSKSDHDNAVRVNGINPDEFDVHKRNMLNHARDADICYGVGAGVGVIGAIILAVEAAKHTDAKPDKPKPVSLLFTGDGVGLTASWSFE